MDSDQIKKRAQALDDAIEKRNIPAVLDFFSEDCEMEMAGLALKGKDGLQRALRWIFGHLREIRLIPITIMIEGETFFEEFIVRTETPKGRKVEVKQAEVLVYDEDYKVKSLRLYFDRLEMGDFFVSNFVERAIVKLTAELSVKGLRS